MDRQYRLHQYLKKAGWKPKLEYRGVYVMQVQNNSSFKNKLQIGDTVLLVGQNAIKAITIIAKIPSSQFLRRDFLRGICDASTK